jgi:hypothetical protein
MGLIIKNDKRKLENLIHLHGQCRALHNMEKICTNYENTINFKYVLAMRSHI